MQTNESVRAPMRGRGVIISFLIFSVFCDFMSLFIYYFLIYIPLGEYKLAIVQDVLVLLFHLGAVGLLTAYILFFYHRRTGRWTVTLALALVTARIALYLWYDTGARSDFLPPVMEPILSLPPYVLLLGAVILFGIATLASLGEETGKLFLILSTLAVLAYLLVYTAPITGFFLLLAAATDSIEAGTFVFFDAFGKIFFYAFLLVFAFHCRINPRKKRSSD